MSGKPLTDEQIWGVPVDTAVEEQPEIEGRTAFDYCPYKKIRCSAWDRGECRIQKCMLE